MTTSTVAVSIVIPVYSGEKYLLEIVKEITKLREIWENQNAPARIAELIFVDDSAVDASPQILDEIASKENWITVLHMSRNFGQHAATIAGILHSSGDWVVTMDEDLQHPPAAIPDLLSKAVGTHADVVYARPQGQIHESRFRDLSSRTYKQIIVALTGNKNLLNANSFRMIRGPVARAASSACIHDTYFDVALSWFTKRFDVVEMHLKDSRFITTGKSGYRLRTLLSHARRMLVSSNLKILRIATIFGFMVVCLSIFASVVLALLHIFSIYVVDVNGWTSIILAINLFGGLSVLLSGISLEYVSILIQRMHGRPLFFAIDRSSDEVLTAFFET